MTRLIVTYLAQLVNWTFAARRFQKWPIRGRWTLGRAFARRHVRVEVPVAQVKAFDYQVLGAIMKVF